MDEQQRISICLWTGIKLLLAHCPAQENLKMHFASPMGRRAIAAMIKRRRKCPTLLLPWLKPEQRSRRSIGEVETDVRPEAVRVCQHHAFWCARRSRRRDNRQSVVVVDVR